VSRQKHRENKSLKILQQIKEHLESLNDKMVVLIDLQNPAENEHQPLLDASLDVMTLLSLPDHLRTTYLTTRRMGRVTAEDVARETRRARAVESGYLNQLVNMDYLNKERIGRKIYFY
jgi:hypothetical protein